VTPFIAVAAQPLDEATSTAFVDVAQQRVRREVDQRVLDQQPAILTTRAVVDHVVGATPGVVIDPLQRVAVQCPSSAEGCLLGGAPDLDLARLAKGGRRLLALPAILPVDRDPTRSAAVDPRMRRLRQRP
jgi:hypothetical protein